MMVKSKIQILPNPKQIQNPKSKLLFWDLEIMIYLAVSVVFVVLGFAFNSYAQSTSSTELINNAKQYDGKIVVYEGEAVGEPMRRGEYVWINVYDGSHAIGIWLTKDLAGDIVYAGSYKSKGDVVAVTGIFHENCLEHGGDLDIHAQALRKVSAGRFIPERLNYSKMHQAIVLGVLCLLIWIFTLLLRR